MSFEYSLLLLIFIFQLIQSFYVIFITLCKPHEDKEFLALELINEIQLIVLMYIGLSSSIAALVGSIEMQWIIGYFSVSLSCLIIVVNLFFMLMHGLRSLSTHCKKKKAANKAK